MKKVLYINPNGFIGGAESFIFNICESHLNNKKISPAILFFQDGPGVKLAQEMGIKYYLLRTKFKLSRLSYIKACFEIRRIIKSISPELIHFTMPYSVVACFLPLLFINVKKIWFQHGPVGGQLDKIASYIYVDCILFNSRDTLKRHFDHCRDIFHTKKKIIKLGIKSNQYKVEKEVEDLFSDKNFNILSAGRICRWKGQHLLIEAIHELKKNNIPIASTIKCFIVGGANSAEDQSYLKELEQLVEQYKLKDHIFFMGHQKNMSIFYEKAHILIHSSTTPEPFGLVVAEAMKAGLLVIGAKHGGVKDILIHNKTGLVFDTTSTDAHRILSELIVESSSTDCSQMRENAKNLIDRDYSISQMTNDIEDTYLKI